MLARQMRPIVLLLTLGLLVAAAATSQASGRSDLTKRVRFVVKPTEVVQGEAVRVVAAV